MYNERDHYRNVKDIDVARPRFAPTPIANKGAGARYRLYLQDEASHVMIDKYGFEKGKEIWEQSIGMGPRGGGMFAISAATTDQKVKMMDDLGLHLTDYFELSYLELWNRWIAAGFGKAQKEAQKKR